jgi:ribonuclease P protein component|tara:strand:- start:1281 stop:1628 length:348 start_codon:yes stop_codon:yes gene_type:complete
MKIKISSLKKNEDFKSLLAGKKISNKYLTIFFKKLSYENNKSLNISFVAQKKIGNAVKRNKIKRRLKNMVRDICKKIKINLNYSYLIIAKKKILEDEFQIIKEELFNDFKKTKKI